MGEGHQGRGLKKSSGTTVRGSARCGFSYGFRQLSSQMMHYQQACCALAYGEKAAGAVNFCEDYALEYMRERFRSALEVDMNAPLLEELKKYDSQNGTECYETLKVYLYCERDQTLAAKKLCIHRNTLVYRVNRLKELIHADLEDEAVRFHLLLSYFISA